MALSEAVNRKFIIAIIEWDGEQIHSLHELKKKAGAVKLKDRLIIKTTHKQRDDLFYTIVQCRSILNENIRDSIRYGMLSQLHLPEYQDIKEIHSYDEWIEKYPIKSDK